MINLVIKFLTGKINKNSVVLCQLNILKRPPRLSGIVPFLKTTSTNFELRRPLWAKKSANGTARPSTALS